MSSTLKIWLGWDEFCCDLELQVNEDGTRSILTMSLEFSRVFNLIQQEQSMISHYESPSKDHTIDTDLPNIWGDEDPQKETQGHLTRTNHLLVSINYGMPFFIWELQELAIDLTLAHCHNWASSSSRRQSGS